MEIVIKSPFLIRSKEITYSNTKIYKLITNNNINNMIIVSCLSSNLTSGSNRPYGIRGDEIRTISTRKMVHRKDYKSTQGHFYFNKLSIFLKSCLRPCILGDNTQKVTIRIFFIVE